MAQNKYSLLKICITSTAAQKFIEGLGQLSGHVVFDASKTEYITDTYAEALSEAAKAAGADTVSAINLP